MIDWIIHYVPDASYIDGVINAHTHGMEKYNHLDFQVVIGSTDDAAYLLNTIGSRVQNGEVFHDGDMVSGLYEDCDVRLKIVQETGRDVLRLIIPDKFNRFPEDKRCQKPYKYQEMECLKTRKLSRGYLKFLEKSPTNE